MSLVWDMGSFSAQDVILSREKNLKFARSTATTGAPYPWFGTWDHPRIVQSGISYAKESPKNLFVIPTGP